MPFIVPQAAPTAIAPRNANHIGHPKILSNSPNIAAARPASEPTDRSRLPETSSMAPGTATMPRTETCSSTTSRLLRVKKLPVSQLKNSESRISATHRPPPCAAPRRRSEECVRCVLGTMLARSRTRGTVITLTELGEELLVHRAGLRVAQDVREVDLGRGLALNGVGGGLDRSLADRDRVQRARRADGTSGIDGLDHRRGTIEAADEHVLDPLRRGVRGHERPLHPVTALVRDADGDIYPGV